MKSCKDSAHVSNEKKIVGGGGRGKNNLLLLEFVSLASSKLACYN